MKLPQLLPECDYTHFCGSCRDKEAGRAFRQTILQVRGIECDVDFECPKGKVWGEQAAPKKVKRKSRGLGDTIAKVTDALHIPKCGRCKKDQARLNKRFPYKNKD